MSEAIATLAAVAMAAVGVTNRSNRKRVTVQASTHDVFIAMVIVVVGAVLLWLPARAQDIGGAASSSLYLPQIERNFPTWFTDAELSQAQSDAGYDVATAQMHTVCTLDASATPPHDIRYSSCEQYWVDGQATEGTQHYIWWLRLNDGRVHGVEVGRAMVSASGTDAL